MRGDRRLLWCAAALAENMSGDASHRWHLWYILCPPSPPQATNGQHVLTHVRKRDPRGAPVDASLEAVSAELNQLNDVAFRDAQAREARVAVGVFTGAGVRQIGSKPPPWPPKVCRCQM